MHLVDSPACIDEWIVIESIRTPIFRPNFRLAVLIAVVLIKKSVYVYVQVFMNMRSTNQQNEA